MNWKRRLLSIVLLSAALLLLAIGWLGRSILWRSPQSEASFEIPAGEEPAALVPLRVDFAGQWQLDLKASDSLDEILKAGGVSALERMILDNAPVTQVIAQADDKLTIDATSGPYHRTDTVWLDGRRTKSEDPAGRPVESISYASDDGSAVITKIWNDAEKPPWVMTRTLKDDGAMEVLNELTPDDATTLQSRRIYRRIGTAPATTTP